MAQQITGNYGSREWIMGAWIQADKTQINMTLFNSFGGTLADLSFQNGKIQFTSGTLPASIKPEYILADFQFVFYKPAALAAALESAGLTMSTNRTFAIDCGYHETRTIYDGTTPIIEIAKSPSGISYTNFLRGYAYILEGTF
jgi:hypothetical protein